VFPSQVFRSLGEHVQHLVDWLAEGALDAQQAGQVHGGPAVGVHKIKKVFGILSPVDHGGKDRQFIEHDVDEVVDGLKFAAGRVWVMVSGPRVGLTTVGDAVVASLYSPSAAGMAPGGGAKAASGRRR